MLDDSTYKLLKELHGLLQNGVITEEEFAYKKSELLEQANAKPEVEEHRAFDFKKWLGKNKWWAVAAVLFMAGLYVSWYFFIRNDPEKDAAIVAAKYCGCEEQLNKNLIAVNESFLASFTSYSFTSKEMAWATLHEFEEQAYDKYATCTNEVKTEKNKYARRYRGKNYRIFEETFAKKTNNYIAKNNARYTALKEEIRSKIEVIKAPKPDVDRVKSDLIGKRTRFWHFEYLSEFATATITNTTEYENRLELTLLLKLLSESTGEHDAEVVVVYFMNEDEQWNFNSVEMNWITYEYTAPVNYWQTITTLENVYTNIDYQNHKIWVRFPCNGEEIIQGPDAEFDARGCSYGAHREIRSREGVPVKIKYKYTPK